MFILNAILKTFYAKYTFMQIRTPSQRHIDETVVRPLCHDF